MIEKIYGYNGVSGNDRRTLVMNITITGSNKGVIIVRWLRKCEASC